MPVATVVLCTVLAAGAFGQPASERDRRNELDSIRARTVELRDELAEIESVGTGVEAELRRLELEVRIQRQMVIEATAERALAEEALSLSAQRVEELESATTEARQRLSSRIVALYRAAPADWIRGLLAVEGPTDLLLYLRTLRFLARRDARLLSSYLEERADLAVERDRLESRTREVEKSIRRERARLNELALARRKQGLVAQALAKERERLAGEAAALSDKERKLALLIAVLADPDEDSMSGAPIQDFRGVLDWPLEGIVSVPFGPRYEARYGTGVPHNGIQIVPGGGGEVRAVFPGVVIFASVFEGFGPTVVVHHHRRVFSLHAGLDELRVVKNDVVVLGRLLGRATSPLYFEIRVENRPQDPMDWLR